MLFFRKKYISRINELINNDNALILVGARQVGKSSIIKILIDNNIVNNHILLNGDELFGENFDAPQDFYNFILFKYNIENIKYLIIDEAQRIKNIGIIIKYLIDLKKNGKIKFKTIISGSGSIEIFKGITDSLIGRYDLLRINPFDFEEFLEFNGINIGQLDNTTINQVIINEIDRYFKLYLKYGGYPAVIGAAGEDRKKEVFKNIYQDYLYKDIGLLLKNNEFFLFEKFLKIFVSKIGSLIKINSLSEEIGVKRNVFEKYIKIISSTYLFDFIKPFHSQNYSNEISKANKGYCLDVGFVNYILGTSENLGSFKGKILENFIYNQINSNKKLFTDIYFWQNKNNSEVDFLLVDNFDKTIIPIEVKNSKKDIIPKSLLSFINKYKDKIKYAIITSDGINKERKLDVIFEIIDYRLFGLEKFQKFG